MPQPLRRGAGLTAADCSQGKEKNILVFDLGGGTFDVSILTIDNGAQPQLGRGFSRPNIPAFDSA